jgi:hypothetical protein
LVGFQAVRMRGSVRIYRSLHLLRRVGPILIGLLLERDSGGRTYRPTFHVHNLGRRFPTIALSLVQPLRTEHTGAAETIDVRSHEQRFEDAARRLSEQAPLPFAGPVSLNGFVEASLQHMRRPGIHYEPEIYEDLISVATWAGDTMRAGHFLQEAKQLMANWPTAVLQQIGGVQRWSEGIGSSALVPEAVRQTVDDETAVHCTEALPSDMFVYCPACRKRKEEIDRAPSCLSCRRMPRVSLRPAATTRGDRAAGGASMQVRSFLTFAADSSDAEEQPPDNEPVPAGRSIAQTIASACRRSGTREAVVRQHSFYGWEFQCGPYWCLLQCPDSWLLIVEDRSSVVWRWVNRRRTSSAFQSFLDEMRNVLEADSRFSKIRFFSKDEYEGRGS